MICLRDIPKVNIYMQEIKWDQVASFNEFKDIPKVHIDNQTINEAVETVFNYLKENKIIN